MKEKVYNFICSHNKALTYEEIASLFNEDEISLLNKSLSELIDELKIRMTNKGKYERFTDKYMKLGKFIANSKGFGFVSVSDEDEDYHVALKNVNGAIDGDMVVIKVLDEGKREASVLRIQKRDLKDCVVGEFYIKDGKNYLHLDDDKLKIFVEIPRDKTHGAVSGHKVIVKLGSKLPKSNYYLGSVVRILGHKDDPGVDILSIAAKYEISDVFPQGVLKELEKIPSSVSSFDKKGRRDLTGEVIFTIDGDDTKDIDDAVSIKKLSNGNYELGVHIADVSYYVKPGMCIYDEAFKRGTSSYLANTVIPMLPHQLSNGICSLNPNEERLAISCVMEINDKGICVNNDIFESVIKSRKQMTYKNVNMILEKNTVPSGYEDFASDLLLMRELSSIIRKSKEEKGYIDFDLDEPKVITNKDGVAIDIVKRERGIGEKLIEDFMIMANENVAMTIAYMDLPFVYRVHGAPLEEKLKSFLQFVSVLGYKVNANLHHITPKTVQNILMQLKGKNEFSILSSMLLRSMQKAVYDTVNIGHFGLALTYYTHFTSPIRRFPDLTVHRLLRTYLFENKIDGTTVDYLNSSLPLIALHSSERERSAVSCERDVLDMKMAEYMSFHIGEVFDGVIDTVTNFGVYVELDNMVEGMIRVEDLGDDYFTYNEATFSLIGKKTNKRYTLGMKVKVVALSVLKDKGQINFGIYKGDLSGDKQQKSKI